LDLCRADLGHKARDTFGTNPESGQTAQPQGQAHLPPRCFVATLKITLHDAEGLTNILDVINMGSACQGGDVQPQIVVGRATPDALNRSQRNFA
jgi:hypothetical protein